jgi:hypothetical protein
MGRFLEVVLELLFIYFLYRLVFDFIIPIYRSSRKVHEHMKDMQQRMEDQIRHEQQYRRSSQAPPPPPPEVKAKEDEYIDYEEVKPPR